MRRGQVCPADREHVRAWLARFAGRGDVAFAVEGCTGWRYVAEELAAAGVTAHRAWPADTAFARGRKRHAKTDRTDCRHLRQLLAEGGLPECWIPPGRILECRALLELYHDLRAEHTAWVQRIHAVLFHQGAPALGAGTLPAPGRAWPRCGTSRPRTCIHQLGSCRSPPRWRCSRRWRPGCTRCRTSCCDAGASAGLAARLYGVGPFAALAMTCWLGGAGRFSSSRQAVRFAGLDVTVWSSDRKGPPRAAVPAGTAGAALGGGGRARPMPGPRPRTTPITPRSRTGATASAPRCRRPARSSGRPATSSPSSATTRSPPPEEPSPMTRRPARDRAGPAGPGTASLT